jgi:hypothetical protein
MLENYFSRNVLADLTLGVPKRKYYYQATRPQCLICLKTKQKIQMLRQMLR